MLNLSELNIYSMNMLFISFGVKTVLGACSAVASACWFDLINNDLYLLAHNVVDKSGA